MKTTKRGITTAILVSTIAAIAVLTVILIFITPKITDILTGTGEQTQCQFSLLVSTVAKTVTLGFGEEVPVECKTTRKTITQNDLARYTNLATQAISSYPSNSEIAKIYPTSQQGKDSWAITKIIADDMKTCYDRGWQGQLKLGDSDLEKYIGGLGNDYLCILCTRYTFDNEVTPIISTSIPIKPWLENNIIEGRTYYEYLTFSKTEPVAIKTLDAAKFDTGESYAVIFMASSAGNGGVYIVPYQKLTSDLGFGVIISGPQGQPGISGPGFVPIGEVPSSGTGGTYRPSICKTIIGD